MSSPFRHLISIVDLCELLSNSTTTLDGSLRSSSLAEKPDFGTAPSSVTSPLLPFTVTEPPITVYVFTTDPGAVVVVVEVVEGDVEGGLVVLVSVVPVAGTDEVVEVVSSGAGGWKVSRSGSATVVLVDTVSIARSGDALMSALVMSSSFWRTNAGATGSVTLARTLSTAADVTPTAVSVTSIHPTNNPILERITTSLQFLGPIWLTEG